VGPQGLPRKLDLLTAGLSCSLLPWPGVTWCCQPLHCWGPVCSTCLAPCRQTCQMPTLRSVILTCVRSVTRLVAQRSEPAVGLCSEPAIALSTWAQPLCRPALVFSCQINHGGHDSSLINAYFRLPVFTRFDTDMNSSADLLK
jgi:hypothetical protein